MNVLWYKDKGYFLNVFFPIPSSRMKITKIITYQVAQEHLSKRLRRVDVGASDVAPPCEPATSVMMAETCLVMGNLCINNITMNRCSRLHCP